MHLHILQYIFTNYLWSRTFSRNERLLYLLNYGTKIIKCSIVACISHFNVEILFSIVILFISFNILISFSSTTLLRSFLNFSSTLHSEYFKSSLLYFLFNLFLNSMKLKSNINSKIKR